MKNRSRDRGAHTSEFSPDPAGTISFSKPQLDIDLWTQSVSGLQFPPSELFSLFPEDLPDMPGNQFLDPSMFKEDEESLTSLDDSTYMSQPDTNRRAAGAQANIPYQFTQEPRPNMTDNFQAQSTYSPSLSAESQGKYPQQAHLTAMLPSAAQEYDLDPAFKVSNTTNFNQEQYTRQTFSHTRFYPESNELGLDETLWSASDLQKYSSPFAVGSTGATAFMSQPQDFSARHGDNPTFFQPYPQYHSDDTSRQVSFSQFPNEQKRPRLPLTTNLSSVSLPSPLRRSSSATVSKSETHPQFSRKSSQASIALATPTIDSVMLSPASSTMGSQRQGGRLNRDNHAQSQAFFDVVEGETTTQSPLQTIRVESDDIEDDNYETPRGNIVSPSSEEVEIRLARQHPLYQASTKADELYHCPYEGQAGCGHKPTKLKCNYDKYVDSHLKPFRCKVTDCVDVQFSSTACLLRHEREAHGMHGHGSKPHLCLYADCDRAIQGNGFPRRYNLFDHMKRVHDYNGPTTPSDDVSPALPISVAPKRPTGRKRKSVATEESVEQRPRKVSVRQTSIMRPPQAPPPSQAQERRRLYEEWNQRRDSLQQHLSSLQGPKDMSNFDLASELAALQGVAEKLAGMG